MNIDALAREAGLCCDKGHWFSPAGDPEDEIDVSTEDITRFAALIRAQADAEASERLSIIADEIIAGLGEPGRGLAEMIREGATALESHAAYVVRDVRAQALDEAARVVQANAEACTDGSMLQVYLASNAAAVRALKDKP